MKRFYKLTATTVVRITLDGDADDYQIHDNILQRLEDKLEDDGRFAFDEIEYELIEEVL